MSTENKEQERSTRRGPDSRFVLGLVVLIALCALFMFVSKKYKEKSDEFENMKTQIQAVQTEIAQHSVKLNEAKAENEKLIGQLTDLQNSFDNLTAESKSKEGELENSVKELTKGFVLLRYPGDLMERNVKGIKYRFRWCPPGSFTMGAPNDEWEYKRLEIEKQPKNNYGEVDNLVYDEKQHEVTLTKGFWILETEVTVGMFKAFIESSKYVCKGRDYDASKHSEPVSWSSPGISNYNQGDNNPVVCVSWDDAVAFCDWLQKILNEQNVGIRFKVSLPTEAQWEYACRAGSKTSYFWGDSNNGDQANCNGASCPKPVRSYSPNAWGIYDMHGNVYEWCQDWYGEYPSESVTDPGGPSSGLYRVLRGGSYLSEKGRCRSANRDTRRKPEDFRNLDGFRCVIVPEK